MILIWCWCTGTEISVATLQVPKSLLQLSPYYPICNSSLVCFLNVQCSSLHHLCTSCSPQHTLPSSLYLNPTCTLGVCSRPFSVCSPPHGLELVLTSLLQKTFNPRACHTLDCISNLYLLWLQMFSCVLVLRLQGDL